MIHRFNPDDDPYHRRLYLVYGKSPEIRRKLARWGRASYWKPDNSGLFFAINWPYHGGTVRLYFVCIERQGSARNIESSLQHEVYHFCVAALSDIGVSGKGKGIEEAFAYYQEWVYGRCLRTLRRAGT